MRQFILGKGAYPTAIPLTTGGQVAITYLNEGIETLVTDAASANAVTGRANIHYKHDDAKLGQTLYPIYKKHFTYVKGEYKAATKFSVEITITSAKAYTDYTVIVALQGKKFNERNKWTSTIHTKDGDTVTTIAAALAKDINAKTIGSGMTAVASAGKITFTAVDSGIGYTIIPADELTNLPVTVLTKGFPAYGDVAYVKDLANKAAADAGFEYTYDELDIYPAYPLNPLAQPDSADVGFTIFTIRCAEPREMKTVDQVIHQIIQIAYPTGAAAITTVEGILKALSGIEEPTPTP